MPTYWFFAGIVVTVAVLSLASIALRRYAPAATVPRLPWPATAAAVGLAAVYLAFIPRVDRRPRATDGFGEAMRLVDGSIAMPSSAAPGAPGAPASTAQDAGSMPAAIARLEQRLARRGGSAADWELLAKAYDFIGRPNAAAKARAHELPADASTGTPSASGAPVTGAGTPTGGAPPAGGTAPAAAPVIRGEIRVAPALSARAKPGETLFVFAQPAESPGPPVAVFRTRVDRWPLRFQLDDSQSMIPGRDLSSAGPVKIVARLSPSGQPLASTGDLEGSTGMLDPTRIGGPVTIVIDRAVP